MTDAETGEATPATYLIVLRHVVVAQDIALTVAEFDPSARILVARNGEEAIPMLDGVDHLPIAFLGKGPSEFRASPIAAELAARGARVVLMGEEAEARGEAEGFEVLVRPFTTDAILARLDPRRPAPRG